METKNSCGCGEKTNTTLFACSGAADLGHISDQVARKLHQNNHGQMKCLAFVGAGIQNMIDSVKDSNMVVIDGCPLDCGKLVMQKNGLDNFTHIRLTDMGYKKGETPAIDQNIIEIYKKTEKLLAQ